jgi:hypothetical protein
MPSSTAQKSKSNKRYEARKGQVGMSPTAKGVFSPEIWEQRGRNGIHETTPYAARLEKKYFSATCAPLETL